LAVNGIADDGHDDWDRRGRALEGQGAGCAMGDDYVGVKADELRRKLW
jgi:hypothetical protein